MHRGEDAIAVYVGMIRQTRPGRPVRPSKLLFNFLGIFTQAQYDTFPGKPVLTAPVARIEIEEPS